MSETAVPVGETTEFALQEKRKLKKSLSRFDMVFVTLCAFVGLDTLGIWLATGLITFWIALGSWVAVFPGTLERLLGLEYDFKDAWGVTQLKYEVLTLGTLAVIFAITVVGYLAGASTRAQSVSVPIDASVEAEPA